MVTHSHDVEQVVLGRDGLIEGFKPGSTLVDMETISPTVARSVADQLRAKGVDMLDAPVSGGPAGAEAATLAINGGMFGPVNFYTTALLGNVKLPEGSRGYLGIQSYDADRVVLPMGMLYSGCQVPFVYNGGKIGRAHV